MWVCVCGYGWRVSGCYARLREYDAEGKKGWVGLVGGFGGCAKSSKVSNFKLCRGLMGKRWTDLNTGQTERERLPGT